MKKESVPGAFCTICTAHYMDRVFALYYSIQLQQPGTELHVLVVDRTFTDRKQVADYMYLYTRSQITNTPFAEDVFQKYGHQPDKLRWSLKPVFTHFAIQHINERIILLDNDICFFDDFKFLFEKLHHSRMLLTPHWRCMNPYEDEHVFSNIFTDGVFNAGFIGANRQATEALEWWAMVCHYKCEKNYEKGLWDDQKYLDMLPARFEGIEVLRHQGCNVASWNVHDCKRTLVNGNVLINHQYPIVFVHFTADTIANVTDDIYGGDALLKTYLEKYLALLKKAAKVKLPHV